MENENAMSPDQVEDAHIARYRDAHIEQSRDDPNDTTPGITVLFYIVAVFELIASVICCIYALIPQSDIDAILHPHYAWFTEIWLTWSIAGLISSLVFYGAGFALKCLDQIARGARSAQ
jgi:uncharacterized membrane protein